MDDNQFRKLLERRNLSWAGYRKVRKGVKKRIRRHMSFLNNEQALKASFDNHHFLPRIVYPMIFDENELEKLRMYGKGLIAPSVAILYLFIALVNYLLLLAA